MLGESRSVGVPSAPVMCDDDIRASAAALVALAELPQSHLADVLGVSQGRVSALLRGARGARLRALEVHLLELAVGVPFGTVARLAVGDLEVAEAVATRDRTVSNLLAELDEVRRDLARITRDGDGSSYAAERAALAVEHISALEAELADALGGGRGDG